MKEVNIYRQELDYSANESYKSLRTNLLFCGEEKKVIAITSCTPNEGKSTVSINLAMSLADSGKKVLFIDADLRKFVLTGRTEVEGEIKGLSHLLSHQETIDNVIYSTNIPRFYIIYAGTVPPNPAELLGGNYFKKLLEAVRKIYDYVIIDTPPLGSVIDGAVIADACDGSILVIESGAISYRFAQEVKEQMERCNCPILGVILNKVDMSRQGYYGKYYGKYYGEYGKNSKNKR
ncbi:MAG: CpsD/CapB family tyrosine-protein kinase [Blautia sp.]|nr:CpsD/CapB family tyrosine-protein kinase [Blautia sp.]